MVLAYLLLSVNPIAQIEAEACEIVLAAKTEISQSPLASGGRLTPPFWGGAAGDRVGWSLDVERTLPRPWLAVRYSYGKRQFGKNLGSRRRLRVLLDGRAAGELHVPDTGGWGDFSLTWVRLPSLTAGKRRIVIESGEAETNTDIDCLGLFATRSENAPAPFVPTVVARSDRFIYRRSPNAELMKPSEVFREFDRIYEEMRRYGGWTPMTPVGIHAIEEATWPDHGWAAYSNFHGVFLRSAVMPKDQGNWCHEMTHLMFQGRIPRWMDEPLVHFLTKQVWVPRLYPHLPERSGYRDDIAKSIAEFGGSPDRSFDRLETVLNVLAGRYGADVFGRFMKACSRAAAKGELELRSERNLTTAETLKYLSEAAGEDVTPVLRHWSGFSKVES